MAGEKTSLELAIEKESETGRALSRTASFCDWMDMSPTSDASLLRLLALHHEPTSPNVKSWNKHPKPPSPENRTRPSSDEQSDPINLNSARKDWIGPRKPSEKKSQVHAPKLFPKSNVPTKIRSNLKRKAVTYSRIQLLPSSSSHRKTAKISTDDLVCEICQVSCSSALTLHQHLIGRPHKAKQEFMKLKRNCRDRKGRMGKPRCDVCQIWCSDKDALSMNFKGKKHKNKLRELELCKKNGTGGNTIDAKRPILCELCSVHCMNEDLFQMHLKGKQHAAKAELKRRGML